MSRIGNKEIIIPDSVNVNIQDKNLVFVEGPKGKLNYQFNKKLEIICKDKIVKIIRPNNENFMKKIHGTTRALLFNMVKGVEKEFLKSLEVVGLDYKIDLKDKQLILHLGFSHPIKILVPEDISLEVIQKTKEINIKGINKKTVGDFAAKIVNFRKPEPYKGKGIRYKGQYVIRKAGKSAKK